MTDDLPHDARILAAAREADLSSVFRARGVVARTGDGVAQVAGLTRVAYEELVGFDSGALGLAFDLRADSTGVLLLSGAEAVRAGEGVVGLARLPELPVGPATLGRVIDPLGNPLDDGGPLPELPRCELFRPAPELIERKAVDAPLRTGVFVIDAAIPIGRGQRELIIGDRNVGKTALAEDAIVAQTAGDVACVYVVIGQAMSRVLTLRETLLRAGALQNTAIVAADASMPPGMRYLAPYAGASVAEWFRDQGGHALVVYDDLTKHADAYRELSLLMDRPPGREAFPGDVFFIHAELLERAAARNAAAGGGSVTALPLVETTESDIAAYIPTNIISITDGQIYLDTARFARNERPAVDIGRSVSRIGGAAQPAPVQIAARNLRILHSRFEELESLARVGLELETGLAQEIARGRLLRALLRQPRLSPRGIAQQVLGVLAVSEGWLDGLAPEQAPRFVESLVARVRSEEPGTASRLERGELPEGDWVERIRANAAALGSAAQEERP
ncbi:MAG: F0F1 ATP synthase subunit alpha [Myxococcales bacterium]|nr:F0F1 ATP synthase subunit alpha [Myxococcales bacterium]MDH5566130.1 F0F1 ATP synthase subunit alpha [Myxococcales bacterium]